MICLVCKRSTENGKGEDHIIPETIGTIVTA